MPPRPSLLIPRRAVVLRQRHVSLPIRSFSASKVSSSNNSKLHPNPDVKPQTDPSPGAEASKDQLPHVSEEAAATANAEGTGGPELQQGTPIGDVVQGDKAAQAKLPKVLQDALKNQQKRSFSTSTRRRRPELESAGSESSLPQSMISSEAINRAAARTLAQLESSAYAIDDKTAQLIADGELPDAHQARLAAELRDRPGLKFPYPEGRIPKLPREVNRRREYPRQDMDVVTQVTNLIMRDGKKATAQRNMAEILNHLRTAPAPSFNARFPLVSDASTGLPAIPSTLPLNPALYLTIAIDSVAPLLRIRSLKGLAGGGMSLQVPMPLSLRQRRRTATKWILDVVERGKGGTSPFPKRFAEEIVKIVEGRSSAWEKRNALHRLATTNRASLSQARAKKRGGGRRMGF